MPTRGHGRALQVEGICPREGMAGLSKLRRCPREGMAGLSKLRGCPREGIAGHVMEGFPPLGKSIYRRGGR